ncbi:perlucin-like protein [Macrobrachium nipponense]|uniref:perlucin-like protein n=1 Tax=Macrobrachium nipponense TaxID=159736 RepID=UPI0030C8B0E8
MDFLPLTLLLVLGLSLASPSSLGNETTTSIILDCPIPYQDVMGRCVHVSVIGVGTWHDMRSYCHSLGGEMIKIDSADFMYELLQFIKSEGIEVPNFWLGGSDEVQEGDWRWTDNTQIKMGAPFWANLCGETGEIILQPGGGTSQNCLCICSSQSFYFNDRGCDELMSVICALQ